MITGHWNEDLEILRACIQRLAGRRSGPPLEELRAARAADVEATPARLEGLMHALHVPLVEIAARYGCTHPYLSRIVRGRKRASKRVLQRVRLIVLDLALEAAEKEAAADGD